MVNHERVPSFRLLMLITTHKSADRAIEMFSHEGLPVKYKINAQGTASSEIMDMLGLGSIDKVLLVSMMPKSVADSMIGKLHTELKLDTVNSGIAFTVPLTGASNLILRMFQQMTENYVGQSERKEETVMTEAKHVLIAAVVNRGYSSNVMDAARAAGAGGGTVVHSLRLCDEDTVSFWGLGVQEEKEIVLILSTIEDKVKIMREISEHCGIHSEAKGMVMSLPIDTAIGIQNRD